VSYSLPIGAPLSWALPRSSSQFRVLVANFVEEISYDGDVDRQHCNPHRSRMAADLVNLEGGQGAGKVYECCENFRS
jgi:hypothetical protein